MSIITARQKLKDIVDTVATAQSFPSGATSMQHPETLTVSPYMVVSLIDHEEEFLDSITNSMNMRFLIRILYSKSDEGGDATIETRIYTIADAVMDALRLNSNFTLGGTAYYLLTQKGEGRADGELANGAVFYKDITVVVKALKSSQ